LQIRAPAECTPALHAEDFCPAPDHAAPALRDSSAPPHWVATPAWSRFSAASKFDSLVRVGGEFKGELLLLDGGRGLAVVEERPGAGVEHVGVFAAGGREGGLRQFQGRRRVAGLDLLVGQQRPAAWDRRRACLQSNSLTS